ncbi:hypothetical protein DXC07_13390 [Bacteroides uniformis]|jgi:hypothetical protein|uniref:Uncharacterized protein n=2 Tax=Bacteroides TaxID=816 RepID=A0A3E4XIR1_BACUN|nr:hypothetical protein [Bacteroides uniformis]RGM54291.1 hypothetical protein DXC07_13390 [Bacteroides uniformis]
MGKLPMKQLIYTFKDISIDAIIEKHIELLKNQNQPQRIITNFDKVTCDSSFVAKIETVEGANKPLPKKQILYKKYAFFIHRLIQRCKSNREGNFTRFNSQILQTVLGNVYIDMLNTLEVLGIIKVSSSYIPSIQARLIELNPNLPTVSEMKYSSYIEEYSDKMQQELKKYELIQIQKIKSEMGDRLYDNFTKSLRLLKLIHREEAEDYRDRHHFISLKSKEYFTYILNEYDKGNFNILSVDKNLRIYSILSQSPRILKNFLNIKFSIDIHNSHPLLFNKLIIERYNINKNILHILYNNISIIDNSYYSVSKQLCKLLVNSGIKKEKIANIPNDILEYIYNTSKGIFWDDFTRLDEFKRLLRSHIKVTLFREVFYSKALTTKGKDFAKVFKKKYPSVYKLVKESKKSDRTYLANEMMKIESSLFRNILTKLYAKRFRVLTIHDAIIVLDVKANTQCVPELVQSIIEKEYQYIGLFPNVSIDYYSTENVKKELQQEEQDMKEINQLIDSFKVIAKDESHPRCQTCRDILKKLEDGTSEIYINHATNEFVWNNIST